MKKLLTICLTVVMAVTLSVSAFATSNGGFVSSPSGNPAPELIEYYNSDADCNAKLIVTPYSKRTELSDDKLALIEEAYKQIKKTTNLVDIFSELKDLAGKLGISTNGLAVSDLFDISYYDCVSHGAHDSSFFIKVKGDMFKHFVGLMCLTENGWKLVPNATLDETGEYLSFTTSDLSIFAVVVDTSANPPQTGETGVWVYLAGMIVSAVTICVILGVDKKKRAA